MNITFNSAYSYQSQMSQSYGQRENHAVHHHKRADTQSVESSAEVTPATASVHSERRSPEEAATAILAHVSKGLESLALQGADPERLDARLQAARAGIASGYADARKTLDDMGLLSDELAAEIDQGEALVQAGLEQLAAGETPDLLKPKETETIVEPAVQPNKTTSVTRISNHMSLDVMTQDGDKITVDLRQRQGSLEVSAGSLNLSSEEFLSRWDLSVEGSLDEGEMMALEKLFSDVQSLSDKFFNGDLGAALSEAMEIGFDGNELASMSLDLRQRSFSSVTRAYGDAAPALPTHRLESQQSRLADYVDSYIKALERAQPLAEPRVTLQEMLSQLVPEDSRLSALHRFNEGLNRLI